MLENLFQNIVPTRDYQKYLEKEMWKTTQRKTLPKERCIIKPSKDRCRYRETRKAIFWTRTDGKS
jgi:hypothetical protein